MDKSLNTIIILVETVDLPINKLYSLSSKGDYLLGRSNRELII